MMISFLPQNGTEHRLFGVDGVNILRRLPFNLRPYYSPKVQKLQEREWMKIFKVFHRFFDLMHKSEYANLYTMTIPIGRCHTKTERREGTCELKDRSIVVVFTTIC
jgi:hypothetical protein